MWSTEEVSIDEGAIETDFVTLRSYCSRIEMVSVSSRQLTISAFLLGSHSTPDQLGLLSGVPVAPLALEIPITLGMYHQRLDQSRTPPER